jgi:hypothetical protein
MRAFCFNLRLGVFLMVGWSRRRRSSFGGGEGKERERVEATDGGKSDVCVSGVWGVGGWQRIDLPSFGRSDGAVFPPRALSAIESNLRSCVNKKKTVPNVEMLKSGRVAAKPFSHWEIYGNSEPGGWRGLLGGECIMLNTSKGCSGTTLRYYRHMFAHMPS